MIWLEAATISPTAPRYSSVCLHLVLMLPFTGENNLITFIQFQSQSDPAIHFIHTYVCILNMLVISFPSFNRLIVWHFIWKIKIVFNNAAWTDYVTMIKCFKIKYVHSYLINGYFVVANAIFVNLFNVSMGMSMSSLSTRHNHVLYPNLK